MVDFVYLGTMMPFPYDFVPKGWLACNGQSLDIGSYTALFSLLGNAYGGNGVTQFSLPRLNATSSEQSVLAVMGQGNGPGLTPRNIGEVVGSPSVRLETDQMPAHSHGFALSSGAANPSRTPSAGAALLDTQQPTYVPPGTLPTTTLANTIIGTEGAFEPHENMQPYLQLYWCICYEGAYPPRP